MGTESSPLDSAESGFNEYLSDIKAKAEQRQLELMYKAKVVFSIRLFRYLNELIDGDVEAGKYETKTEAINEIIAKHYGLKIEIPDGFLFRKVL